MTNWIHPTGNKPEHVVMLLLGETKREYADALSVKHERPWPGDPEIWTCNSGFRIWDHDLLFVMDDLEQEAHKWPEYGGDLEMHAAPIITSKAYPQWGQARDYPYIQICDALGLQGMNRYFFNTVPFMIAYALFIGVKKISIFGADYWHPALPGMREADHANAEWWLGFAAARGMAIELPRNSTLMAANQHDRPTYGYRMDPRLDHDRELVRRAQEQKPPSTMDEAGVAHQDMIAESMGIDSDLTNRRTRLSLMGLTDDAG